MRNHDFEYGTMTVHNAPQIAARLAQMLAGRTYTWVDCNEGIGAYEPRVRVHQKADSVKLIQGTYSDGTPYASVMVHDTYGVWSITSIVTETGYYHDPDFHAPYVSFASRGEGVGVTITHRAPAGYKLYWHVTMEDTELHLERLSWTNRQGLVTEEGDVYYPMPDPTPEQTLLYAVHEDIRLGRGDRLFTDDFSKQWIRGEYQRALDGLQAAGRMSEYAYWRRVIQAREEN
jgi:hypothetical protein